MNENDVNKFYTYIYYDTSRNNEPIYVGKGHGNRAWQHLSINKVHPFIQRLQYMKKHNVKIVVGFYSCLDDEFSMFLEEELISHFGRRDLNLGPLLNLTNGGEGPSGTKITNETRKKLSLAKKGKSVKIRNSNSSHRGMIKEKMSCPHCNKEGGKGAMQRWHFDNCKEK